MNKTAIKNFAVWARNKLIAEISYRAGLMGITENGIAEPLPQSAGGTEFYDIGAAEPYSISGAQVAQRGKLAEAIRRKEHDTDYKTAYNYIMEEVAYTWFNRLIAVRFMEVNDYLPSHIRVLSSETGKSEPDLVTTPFDAGLPFTEQEKVEIIRLKQENKLDEAFRLLFIKQCNALNEILPALFEKTGDYTELLLNLSVIDQDGVVWHLVHDIDEEDFDVNQGGQVEIIGWLYQYYNTEPKDETFALLKKNVKITKERIPSATALFTPDWIVRYMVENSLGRLWVEGHPNDNLKANWKYYLDEAEQTPDVQMQLEEIRREYQTLNPEDIRVIDPCMGSGHILVYAFDILMQIYEAQGYTRRDAVRSTVENNLYGLDIDGRAAQLAYFAVMMKARSYDRRFLTRKDENGNLDIPQPHVYAIGESNTLSDQWLVDSDQMQTLFDVMRDAKEYGSILTPPALDFDALRQYARDMVDAIEQVEMEHSDLSEQLPQVLALIDAAEVLTQKFHIVATNPPYMRNRGMDASLVKYVKKHFEAYKFDLYAVFIARCQEFLSKSGFMAMITQHSFMFLSRFEQIRRDFYMKRVINMVHLGTRAFEEIGGEVVQTTSFVVNNINVNKYSAKYIKLTDYGDAIEKENQFYNRENMFYSNQERFEQIPGGVLAYWVSDQVINVFEDADLIENLAYPRKGNSTSDNDRFLRLWFEVKFSNINIGAKFIDKQATLIQRWFPYNKGGSFRKWYGNNEYIVDWKNDAEEMRRIPSAVIANYQFFTQPGVTWSTISGGDIGVRRFGYGFIFDNKGECLFCDNFEDLNFFAAYLNSKSAMKFLSFLSPTLDFNCGYIAKLPVRVPKEDQKDRISVVVDENVIYSKADWDAFETSWDFKRHPLV